MPGWAGVPPQHPAAGRAPSTSGAITGAPRAGGGLEGRALAGGGHGEAAVEREVRHVIPRKTETAHCTERAVPAASSTARPRRGTAPLALARSVAGLALLWAGLAWWPGPGERRTRTPQRPGETWLRGEKK